MYKNCLEMRKMAASRNAPQNKCSILYNRDMQDALRTDPHADLGSFPFVSGMRDDGVGDSVNRGCRQYFVISG